MKNYFGLRYKICRIKVTLYFIRCGKPKIINSDQGSQFTSDNYTMYLQVAKIRQSMDGKARWVDNVIIERWFRSLKLSESTLMNI